MQIQETYIDMRDAQVLCTYKKSKRSRSIRIDVLHSREIRVTIPYRVSFRGAAQFVQEKHAWIQRCIDFFNHEVVYVEPPEKTFYSIAQYRHRAKQKVLRLIKKYNAYYQFDIARVSIRDQKTKWGSCSSAGNLNFHYKILFLPDHLAEYLVVHELCHLKEMNHSKRFWQLVAQTIPDVKQKARELRRHIP